MRFKERAYVLVAPIESAPGLTGLGFIRSKSDTSLYTYIGPDGEWCAIAVFVDDLLITGTSTAKIDELRTYLDRTFKGEGAWDECVNPFLGMRMSYKEFPNY